MRKAHAHDGELLRAHFRRRVLLGKERDLPRRIVILAEKSDALAPRCLLPPVEFAEVEHMPLGDALVAQTTIFNDAPIEVLFAILATF